MGAWRGDPFLRYRYSQAVPVGFSPQSRLRDWSADWRHLSWLMRHFATCQHACQASRAAPSDEPEEARLFRVVDSAHAKARGGSAWEWPRPPQLQRRLGQGAWLVPLMHYASHGEKGARERQDPATRGAKNQR